MRISAHVLLAYLMLLVLGCVWRFVPAGRIAPDIAALVAVFLGITARSRLAPSVAGAVVVGYLADLLMGAPTGVSSFVCGIVCVVGHVVHRRILVRGLVMTAVSAAFTGLWAGILAIGLRLYLGWIPGTLSGEFSAMALTALVTGLVGPGVFWTLRAVDRRFRQSPRLVGSSAQFLGL